MLVIREGGRIEPFNFRVPYPEPYVPRRLTFEIPERVNAEGEVLKPLDEAAVLAIVERLKALKVEAVGVCLLWSIVNPEHERRLGELLARASAGRARDTRRTSSIRPCASIAAPPRPSSTPR